MKKPLFHPSLYEFDRPQPSYWEASAGESPLQAEKLDGGQSCDVAIVGGGYTGLSAALHLARDFDIDVCLLEAGHIGWGASGRNGGFCTMGMTKLSLAAQLKRFGVEETRAFHQSQADAVNLVRTLGEDEDIDFLPQGDAEYLVADSDAHFAAMQKQAEIESKLLGLDISVHSRTEFSEIGYDSPHQHGAVAHRPSFALHPLRYARGLAAAAQRRGARLHAHSEVLSWRKRGDDHILETAGGSLSAKRVILTGNGFMPEHLHRGVEGRPLPLQSAIVVTRPMEADELRQRRWFTENPTFNSKHMFFYYRLLSDGRFMLGGRANHVGDPDGAEATYAGLKKSIGTMWPQFADLEYTHQWRGLVCFSMNFRPSLGRMPEDPSVYFAYGYHGNGVNSATWSGRELARWLAGRNSGRDIQPKHLPALVRGQAPRFPLARLRRHYLRLGIAYYRLRDYFDW